MKLYEEIGKILKYERLRKEISLDQLVDKIGGIKTKSTLKRYEDGKSRIDMDILPVVCKALNIDCVTVIKKAENEVNFYNSSTTNINNHDENLKYLVDKPELLELYKEIVANDQLVLLFNIVRTLNPQDLEQILKIIDTFNKETI
ncbi:helix-turn-helix transcriptional regulator [Thomasclavelia sp.]|uniref:helix-turn-helix domain-containing protein n=1 Tax=Thomasclavelia sp. TaxID=3025757 RepID=UPI0025D9F2DE|nr:helix-turn-helix transcriptional regulator [Thomasclavelia sp.]